MPRELLILRCLSISIVRKLRRIAWPPQAVLLRC